MFAVFSSGELKYFGDSLNSAMTVFLGNKNAQMMNLGSPEPSPVCSQETEVDEPEATGLSQAAQKLLDNLKKTGFTPENIEKLAEEGSKTLAEVKSLGIKGMQTVGDKFVALGESLRKAPTTDEPESEKFSYPG